MVFVTSIVNFYHQVRHDGRLYNAALSLVIAFFIASAYLPAGNASTVSSAIMCPPF